MSRSTELRWLKAMKRRADACQDAALSTVIKLDEMILKNDEYHRPLSSYDVQDIERLIATLDAKCSDLHVRLDLARKL